MMKRQHHVDPRRHPVFLAMPMSDADRQQAETLVHMALAEFAAGIRTPQVCRELLLAGGMCAALANNGIGPEAYQVGLLAVQTLGEDEPNVETLRAMVEALDSQRRLATRGELQRALRRC